MFYIGSALSLFYILNAAILISHEIESAYWEEWKILKLPGKVSAFVVLNFFIAVFLLWGSFEISRLTFAGYIIALIAGFGGLIPFLVHKIIAPRKKAFNLLLSNILIFSNIATGVILIYLALKQIF
ncbi:MAG: DUF6713 family protein [Brevinematales bacterium]|jgi:hypothetical protein